MARPTLFSHRKFRRLCSIIGEPKALGCLEWIWSSAYESGEPYLGDVSDVELAGRWDGAPGVLCSALLSSGFIDIDEHEKHYVHDLYDHAPNYVQNRMMRELERQKKGITISDIRRDAGRAGGLAKHNKPKQMAANESLLLTTSLANLSTPAPAPAPAPAQTDMTTLPGVDLPKKERKKKEPDKFFAEFWEMYPKKVGKIKAGEAWMKLNDLDKDDLLNNIGAALAWQCASDRWTKLNGEYIPDPSTYINQRRWEDERQVTL